MHGVNIFVQILICFHNADECTWLTATNDCCKFPFQYWNTEYYSCTADDSDNYWCYLGDDNIGNKHMCHGTVLLKRNPQNYDVNHILTDGEGEGGVPALVLKRPVTNKTWPTVYKRDG